MDEGVPVALGALHDPLSARREIVHDDGRFEPQRREVDDIEVGAIARGNHSAVVESITSGRRQGLLVHKKFERQLRAACPIARLLRPDSGWRDDSANCGRSLL